MAAGVIAMESLLDGGPDGERACGDFFLDGDEAGAYLSSSPRAHRESMDESLAESVGVFEGPEKTLEVCFLPGVGAEGGCRGLERSQLDTILVEARCTILSSISNAHLDAYVLSESSLFVYPFKVVIKTCGRTTLLRCVRPLVDAVTRSRDFGGLGLKLEWVGYSRKNYAFPDEQPSPHTSFGEELAYLRAHKDDAASDGDESRDGGGHDAAAAAFDGQGYVLGPITGDHWFVYVADQCERPAASATERTINIMMFDLADDVRDAFYLTPHDKTDMVAAARAMTHRSGLVSLLPSASHVDDHAFAPCGYSMNALCFESYTTVHVTPEKTCSYASFETNTALKSYASLIKNVLAVFKPRKVVVTLFADEAGLSQLPKNATLDGLPLFDINKLGTYVRNDLSLLHVEHDFVCMMANYSKSDKKKKSPHKKRADSPFNVTGNANFSGPAHVGSLQ